jgi:CRISPR-associated protein Cas1
MFGRRFPGIDLSGKSLKEMMGMEGSRVRALYESKAQQYGVGWKGRSYSPGKFELSDGTNKILTACNAALYGILSSVVHSLGYTPHVGFIHSGSPLPFIYDLADLYKEDLCIDLAFSLTLDMLGDYDRQRVSSAFRQRVIATDLLGKSAQDIEEILGVKNACRDCQ